MVLVQELRKRKVVMNLFSINPLSVWSADQYHYYYLLIALNLTCLGPLL